MPAVPALSAVSAAISFFSPRPAVYLVLGIGVLAVTALPRLLHDKPMSFPVPLLALGALAFALPLDFADPDPVRHAKLVEHVTEVVVIVALANAGLKLDRRFRWREWGTTWRLLGITMPLSVAFVGLLGWWLLDLPAATALLLGACIAPTDPVLASEVQVGGPGQGSEAGEVSEREEDDDADEDEVRFGLTSEAGLNDALAFPYVNLAVVAAAAGSGWTGELTTWLLADVLYKAGVGIVVGLLIGTVLAKAVLALPSATDTGKAMTGAAALAVTAVAYGLTEWLGGYGFLATFIAAYTMRHSDRDHEYHEALVIFVEQVERVLVVPVIVVLGGVCVRGFPGGVSWRLVAFAVLTLLLARPLAGLLGLVRGRCSWFDAGVVAFFGIRGVGSLYYVAHAASAGSFSGLTTVWAAVLLVTVLSLVLHGVTGTPVLHMADARRARAHR